MTHALIEERKDKKSSEDRGGRGVDYVWLGTGSTWVRDMKKKREGHSKMVQKAYSSKTIRTDHMQHLAHLQGLKCFQVHIYVTYVYKLDFCQFNFCHVYIVVGCDSEGRAGHSPITGWWFDPRLQMSVSFVKTRNQGISFGLPQTLRILYNLYSHRSTDKDSFFPLASSGHIGTNFKVLPQSPYTISAFFQQISL